MATDKNKTEKFDAYDKFRVVNHIYVVDDKVVARKDETQVYCEKWGSWHPLRSEQRLHDVECVEYLIDYYNIKENDLTEQGKAKLEEERNEKEDE